MRRLTQILKLAMFIVVLFTILVPLYALPAMLSLPGGVRPGLEALTIEGAARQLRSSGLSGWELVEEARSLVESRMQYSRRNSYDSAKVAFQRGYGYSVQMSYALADLLQQLGFDARVVQAFQNRFPDGEVTSHSWVEVTLEDETRYIDSLFYDAQAGRITFEPLSEITSISPLFKAFTWWGAGAVNAHRYYLTGKDL